MSLIETVPQKQKEYDNRKQDHGDAAQKKQHVGNFYNETKHEAVVKHDKVLLREGLSEENINYAFMTPRQLEAEADKMLGESVLVASTSSKVEEPLEPEQEENDGIDYDNDGFLTEADFGIKSKWEIRREMARRVTLDADYDQDDTGDNDLESPMNVRNRL